MKTGRCPSFSAFERPLLRVMRAGIIQLRILPRSCPADLHPATAHKKAKRYAAAGRKEKQIIPSFP